ncbi:hypothetical protein P7C73_g5266, partial [Tremellales sp. Uapishka_1]
ATSAPNRYIAVVPVLEIERRVGRWATAARIRGIDKAKGEDEIYRLVLEGVVSVLHGCPQWLFVTDNDPSPQARIRLPPSLPPVLSILPPLPLPVSVFSLPVPPQPTTPLIDLLPLALRVFPDRLHDHIKTLPPGAIADLFVIAFNLDWETRVEILGLYDIEERINRVYNLLPIIRAKLPPSSGPSNALTIAKPLSGQVTSQPPNQQAQPALPEDLQPLYTLLVRRGLELTPSVHQTVSREIQRLSKIPQQSGEYGVGKTYIEWLLALPWNKVSETGKEVDLEECKRRLEGEHEGLEGVKRRVVEYLAVYRLKKQLFDAQQKLILAPSAATKKHPDDADSNSISSALEPAVSKHLLDLVPPEIKDEFPTPSEPAVFRDKGPILLLVGPPGVGKTSIAKSLASALGREFHRISLGGVRDEAEIRGHRRTYVGALPGLLVQGLRKVGVSNPLILLDEIDKIGTSNFHGDPAAALLETLDTAQNWGFHDHYLGDVTIDLSQVLFIATANTLETISAPLLDRCEVIECSGYVLDEKLAIGRRFLLPKQIEENGLEGCSVEMRDEVMGVVISDYTREAGVRGLEREIGKICRTKAVQYSMNRKTYDPSVSKEDVERILGIARFEPEIREETHRPGVVTGLAYQGSGTGGILLIESMLVPGGKGNLILTGSLGEVIKESAGLALNWVKSKAVELGIAEGREEDPLKGMDIHLHLPAGAVKKDGPSAGIGMVLAFVSLLLGKSIPADLAVTGEITLRGAVTPVGGIKEKVLGAHRAGITKLILPKRNQKDVENDVKERIREDMMFKYVERIEEVIEEVWGGLRAGDVVVRRGRGEARL